VPIAVDRKSRGRASDETAGAWGEDRAAALVDRGRIPDPGSVRRPPGSRGLRLAASAIAGASLAAVLLVGLTGGLQQAGAPGHAPRISHTRQFAAALPRARVASGRQATGRQTRRVQPRLPRRISRALRFRAPRQRPSGAGASPSQPVAYTAAQPSTPPPPTPTTTEGQQDTAGYTTPARAAAQQSASSEPAGPTGPVSLIGAGTTPSG
jgi:hypothetical protein